jgi:hypothetical protein
MVVDMEQVTYKPPFREVQLNKWVDMEVSVVQMHLVLVVTDKVLVLD